MPTLIYSPNFPRTEKIRVGYAIKKLILFLVFLLVSYNL